MIAAGLGSFQPRRLGVEGCDAFEDRQVHYRVRSAAEFDGQRLVIFGGGDSALDWVIDLNGKAKSIVHVHRRNEFKAAPASVARMRELVAAGKMEYVEGIASGIAVEDGRLTGVTIKRTDGASQDVAADHLLAFFGLHPKLGPIAEWGFELEKKAIKVDTAKFQTSVPGHLRDRRHQHLPGQEEADPERLPRSGAGGVRHRGAPEPREEGAPAVHDDQPDHAEAARRDRVSAA